MDMDDDDLFLYGEAKPVAAVEKPATVPTNVPQPIPLEQAQAHSTSNGLVADLEKAAEDATKNEGAKESIQQDTEAEDGRGEEDGDQGDEEENGDEEEEESDDDIEIIMEPAARSLDFRQQGARPSTGRTSTGPLQTPTRAPAQQQPSLTTEYTPRERGTINKLPSTPSNAPSTSTPAPGPPQADSKSSTDKKAEDAGPDPSTLPVATAPPSHPSIDPSAPGVFDGRSILELDLAALAEKPWRRPGADISDWFNYGFDEISWEAYCYRRRELGEVASVLKANVLNFAGMPEEQLLSLPPDIRTMVMTSATAMMNQAGPNGMLPPGAGMTMNGNGMMNPMMDMNAMMNPMMQDMSVVGMGGDMGAMGGPMPMGGPGPNQGMGAGVMQQGPAPGMGGGGGLSGGVGVGTGAPQGANPEQMVMGGDNFVPGNVGPQGMMTMNMGGEFTLQETNVGQQPFPGAMDQRSNTPVQPVPAQNRAGGPGPFRGRGMPPQMNMRGRGGTYAGRGRLPIRPPSPLPPNVPTGPRNKNKYKDIDGSAPAVDGLDYGGGGGGGGGKESRGTPPDYRDDDRGSRKRRSSPSLDDSRGSKRR